MHHRACYPAIVLYVIGFVVLGAALQHHLSIGAVIMGWGISHVAVMIGTVAICGLLCLTIFLFALCPNLLFLQMHTAMTASLDDRFDRRHGTLASGMLTTTEQGEVSALVNTSRTLGGFSVAYFQVPWATKNGALQTLGVEAACAFSADFAIIYSLTSPGKIVSWPVCLSLLFQYCS
jgi:hypothetical protein